MRVSITVAVATTTLLCAGVATAAASAAEVAPPKPTPTVQVGSSPIDVVVSVKNGEVYVLNDGSVSVVDTTTHQQVAEVGTGENSNQDSLALGRGDSRAYLTNPQLTYVLAWRTASRTNGAHVAIGKGGTSIAVGGSGDKQRAYVARLQVEKVATFHTHGKARVQQLKVPGNPDALAVAPDGRVWVADSNDSVVWVVGRGGKKIKETIHFSQKTGAAEAIAFAPDGDTVWLVGMGGLRALDVDTHASVGFVTTPKLFGKDVPANPAAIAFSPSGASILALNGTFPDSQPPQVATVAAVDATSLKVGTRWMLGHQSYGLAVDEANRTAYAPNYADDTLSYFRTPR